MEAEVLVMAKTMLEIPDEQYAELNKYKDKLSELLLLGLSQMKIEEALVFYQRGLVSFARGSELAGISQTDMMKQAMARGIEPLWSDKMIEEELA